MSSVLVVKVFREDTRQTVSGIRVTVSGGYGEKYTDGNGKAVFELPDGVNYVDVYVNGSHVKNHDITKGDLMPLVSPSGYYTGRTL